MRNLFSTPKSVKKTVPGLLHVCEDISSLKQEACSVLKTKRWRDSGLVGVVCFGGGRSSYNNRISLLKAAVMKYISLLSLVFPRFLPVKKGVLPSSHRCQALACRGLSQCWSLVGFLTLKYKAPVFIIIQFNFFYLNYL